MDESTGEDGDPTLAEIIRQHLSDLDKDIERERRGLKEVADGAFLVVNVGERGEITTWPQGELLPGNFYRDYYVDPKTGRNPWPVHWYNREWFWDDNQQTDTVFPHLPPDLDELIREWVEENTEDAEEFLERYGWQRKNWRDVDPTRLPPFKIRRRPPPEQDT
jgi:hypothetical protein